MAVLASSGTLADDWIAYYEKSGFVEDYVMEDMAAQMLASDPQLKDEFRRLLEIDSVFATSPHTSLDFFYLRMPYFDQKVNVYSISRVIDKVEFKINQTSMHSDLPPVWVQWSLETVGGSLASCLTIRYCSVYTCGTR